MFMTARFLSVPFAAILLIAPFSFAQNAKPSPAPKSETAKPAHSSDMEEAIAWEHHKEAAAARQAAIEAKHPTVTYDSADRKADDTGSKVKDSKAPGAKRDK
jgi:hypothetical protein